MLERWYYCVVCLTSGKPSSPGPARPSTGYVYTRAYCKALHSNITGSRSTWDTTPHPQASETVSLQTSIAVCGLWSTAAAATNLLRRTLLQSIRQQTAVMGDPHEVSNRKQASASTPGMIQFPPRRSRWPRTACWLLAVAAPLTVDSWMIAPVVPGHATVAAAAREGRCSMWVGGARRMQCGGVEGGIRRTGMMTGKRSLTCRRQATVEASSTGALFAEEYSYGTRRQIVLLKMYM